MFRFTTIRRAALLLAAFVLFATAPSEAHEPSGQKRKSPRQGLIDSALRAIPDAWAALLKAAWAEEGSSLDPFGNPKPDEGSSLDPFGAPEH